MIECIYFRITLFFLFLGQKLGLMLIMLTLIVKNSSANIHTQIHAHADSNHDVCDDLRQR